MRPAQKPPEERKILGNGRVAHILSQKRVNIPLHLLFGQRWKRQLGIIRCDVMPEGGKLFKRSVRPLVFLAHFAREHIEHLEEIFIRRWQCVVQLRFAPNHIIEQVFDFARCRHALFNEFVTRKDFVANGCPFVNGSVDVIAHRTRWQRAHGVGVPIGGINVLPQWEIQRAFAMQRDAHSDGKICRLPGGALV